MKPGESQKVEFSLSEDAFSYYDVDQVSFVVDEGSYDISVGFSADELLLKEEVVIKKSTGLQSDIFVDKTYLLPTVVEAGESVNISFGIVAKADVYNTSGVLKANLYNTDRIPTTGLTQGMYVVHMCVNDKKINGKFIVK